MRPFVEAGVLRAPLNIHWKKDRGKNPDGSERENDIHLTLAEKRRGTEASRTSMSETVIDRVVGCASSGARVRPERPGRTSCAAVAG